MTYPPSFSDAIKEVVDSAPTPESTPRRPRPLRFAKTPRVHYFPNKPRDPKLVSAAVRDLVSQLVAGNCPWPLFVHGTAGTGKTCFGLSLVDYCGGFYFAADEFAEVIADALMGRLLTPGQRREISALELWHELTTAPIVVLDELGASKTITDHHYRSIKRLLDVRENEPMVVLANVPLYQIAVSYGEPVASRLAGGTVYHLQGPDRRLTNECRHATETSRPESGQAQPGATGAVDHAASTGDTERR